MTYSDDCTLGASYSFEPCHLKQEGFNRDAIPLLCSASSWAYSNFSDFCSAMERLGIKEYECTKISVENGSLISDTEAYFIKSDRIGILAFRGTEFSVIDLLTDASISPVNIPDLGEVHGGFYMALATAWPKIIDVLNENINTIDALYITGHSLGGALASLTGVLLAKSPQYANISGKLVGIYTFGQPMIGYEKFAKEAERLIGSKTHRFVYKKDVVARLPGVTAGKYAHFGNQYNDDPTLGWKKTDNKSKPVYFTLSAVGVGIIAWLISQFKFLRWLSLNVSWRDHEPTNYLKSSGLSLTGM